MGAGDGGRPQHGDSGKVRPGAGPARNPGERPTVDALRSGRELFREPPPRATREEYVAFLEGRKRAELPARVQQLREDLPRYERDAALSAEQATSEERRVGKEWGSTCRSRWSPEHTKKNAATQQKNNSEHYDPQ